MSVFEHDVHHQHGYDHRKSVDSPMDLRVTYFQTNPWLVTKSNSNIEYNQKAAQMNRANTQNCMGLSKSREYPPSSNSFLSRPDGKSILQ